VTAREMRRRASRRWMAGSIGAQGVLGFGWPRLGEASGAEEVASEAPGLSFFFLLSSFFFLLSSFFFLLSSFFFLLSSFFFLLSSFFFLSSSFFSSFVERR
jgi:hypothetical protein